MTAYTPQRFAFKFQHWIVAVNVGLVLVLTGAFLWMVFSKFSTLAEVEATEKFNLVAENAIGQIRQHMQNHRSFAELVSTVDAGFSGAGAQLNAETLLPVLTRGLKAQSSRYSVYFGYPNDDFLQVLRVGANPVIAKALKAPPEADDAIRMIRKNASGVRTETWTFRSATGQVLAQTEQPADYQPSTRPWYKEVMEKKRSILTAPYVYASIQALGLTFAAPVNNTGVFGLDVTLNAFETTLKDLKLSPHGGVIVLDEAQNVLALRGNADFFGRTSPGTLAKLGELGSPYLSELDRLSTASTADTSSSTAPSTSPHTLDGKVDLHNTAFVLATRAIEPAPGRSYRIYVMAPLSDFTAVVEQARLEMLALAGMFILILVPLAYFGTQHVVRALAALARHSEHVRQLDFSKRPEHVQSFLYEVNALGRAQEVMHDSIMQRTQALEEAKNKLAQLVEGGIMLGRETEHDKLLRHILYSARDIAECSAASLFLRTEQNTLRLVMRTGDAPLPVAEFSIDHNTDPQAQLITHVARTGETVNIGDMAADIRFDTSRAGAFGKSVGLDINSVLTVPLAPHDGEVLGVLQLLSVRRADPGQAAPFEPEMIGFIKALAAQSAVALENQGLVKAQKDLMNAIIRLVAGAVDAKSAYTGGHCERVPELAFMLAEEAGKVATGPLAEFGFRSEEEWYEFRVGAWLHDCGKVTTPEYVVDKATKLETIYNRIHEVRTRFEVLLRDAEIATLKNIAAGADAENAWAEFESRKKQLLDDFAFIAEANVGAEYMAPEKMERVRAIAAQPWLRHFDDRLGLSQDESDRLGDAPPTPLPAPETLLADKTGHIVPRPYNRALDPKYGFKVKVPEHLYNRGEVYNLCISRGTLSEEERFKINEHIIQTIVMLDAMPFPNHMQRVPEYAGTHHETLTGSGYPRKLDGSDLSIPARIMAIADIFEALTAADRPYKKAKTLSESVKVLSFFKKDGHIDPVLFDLFLTSGVYRKYGERFLHPSQLDEVDISLYLTPAPSKPELMTSA